MDSGAKPNNRQARRASSGRGGRGRGRGRGGGRGRGRGRGVAKSSTARREAAEVEHLDRRIAEEVPPSGTSAAKEKVKKFAHLPLSSYTVTGLNKSRFTHMTRIQRLAIPHALAGRDVLGAAKTGSGKTLAFMIPVVEALFRARWSTTDGLGALIISPTRELTMQIFEVIKVVCSHHFSITAGYVTGGKRVADEAKFIKGLNILVATPGRLLQHLEQTPGFDAGSLQVLVLDEADRLLDMGFEEQLNSIVEYLPAERQTLLFSATQTKSVKDLARLSMRDPEYVAVHEKAMTATPVNLSQFYTVCPLQDKMNLLYSFVKSHLKAKTIVFLSSCKQARFVFEVMRRVRPGVSVMALHGKQKPKKRSLVYMTFLEKKSAVLFATDVAARGLDFPSVDWVLQLDCPDDAESYIHRVGRTARHRNKGNGLLVLLPNEVPGMLKELDKAKVPTKQIKVNQKRAVSAKAKISAEVAADPELRHLAKKAFTSYMRSVHLQPNKDIFDVHALPTLEYAQSLGLPSVPTVKFLAGATTRDAAREAKNTSKKLQKLKAAITSSKKKQQAKNRRRDSGASSADESDSDGDSSDGGDDEFLKPKQRPAQGSDSDSDSDVDEAELVAGLPEGLGEVSRSKVMRLAAATKELGESRAAAAEGRMVGFKELAQELGSAEVGTGDAKELAQAAARRVERVAARLRTRDVADRAREKRRVKAKHLQERLGKREDQDGDQAVTLATLGGSGDDSADSASSGDDSDSDGSGSGSEDSFAGAGAGAGAVAAGAVKRKRGDAAPVDANSLSLEDAEQAALRLLQRRRLV